MTLEELTGPEKTALVGLLAYMVDADGVAAREEAIELLAIQREMGASNIIAALEKVLDIFDDKGEMVAYAKKNVERDDARELIRTVLHDLAMADGNRVRNERDLLDDLTLAWARSSF